MKCPNFSISPGPESLIPQCAGLNPYKKDCLHGCHIETFEKRFPLQAGFKIKAHESRFSGINHRNILNISPPATAGRCVRPAVAGGERGRFSKVSKYVDKGNWLV